MPEKNHELMIVEQHLQYYSSPTSSMFCKFSIGSQLIFSFCLDGSVITKEIDKFGALKEATYLHGLSFEITLLSKGPGEDVFHQHGDIQYISQISIESK